MNLPALSPKQIKWGVAALVLLYLLSVLLNLGLMELEGEEPRRAVVSLEMMQSGRYFNPTLFGWPYYNKPPVFNWIMIGSMGLLQSASEFALRLPSLLCYVLWAAIHYRVCRRYFSAHNALLSAFMMLTCVDVYFYGLANGAEIDIFYSFVVYLQAVAIFHYYEQKAWLRLFSVSYLLCAVGFLTKGFPSLLFEGLTLVGLCFYARSVRLIFRPQHLVGIALFAMVLFVFFWTYSRQGNVAHLLVNFLNESLVKSAIGERSDRVFGKALGYPVLVLKLLAPWSLLLLALFVRNVRLSFLQGNALVRFALLFIAANLWVYWFTGQPKARYIYMFVPFATILFTRLYELVLEHRPPVLQKWVRNFGYLFLAAAVGVPAVSFATGHMMVGSVVAGLVLGLFAWIYLKGMEWRLWKFVGGIILLRMVYAVIFIPLQDKGTAHYEAPVKAAVAQLGGAPLRYWGPAQDFRVAIDTKVYKVVVDTVTVPPLIHPQVPYYYYKHSGRQLLYDTARVPGSYYISFDRDLEGSAVDSIFSFTDKSGTEKIVVYRMR